MAIRVPILTYGLRLFNVVLQVYQINCLHVCMMTVRGCYHFTKFHCSTPSGF